MEFGPIFRQWMDALPQDKFWEVRRARTQPGADQQKLALEDRRAFSREMVRDNGLLSAASLGLAIPAEQAVKAMTQSGRSGFFDPMGNIRAGYTGILQGLDDNGMFGRRPTE